MKTKEEIENQIAALKEVRPKVVPRSMFGDDNLAQLDAQVAVLENYLDTDEIYKRFDHSGTDIEVLDAALFAREWLDGGEDVDDLAEGWPLKK